MLIESGRFDRHLRRMRSTYQRRREVLVTALAEHAPRARLSGLAAGHHAVVDLPPGVEEGHVVAEARARRIAVTGMSTYRADGGHEPAAAGARVRQPHGVRDPSRRGDDRRPAARPRLIDRHAGDPSVSCRRGVWCGASPHETLGARSVEVPLSGRSVWGRRRRCRRRRTASAAATPAARSPCPSGAWCGAAEAPGHRGPLAAARWRSARPASARSPPVASIADTVGARRAGRRSVDRRRSAWPRRPCPRSPDSTASETSRRRAGAHEAASRAVAVGWRFGTRVSGRLPEPGSLPAGSRSGRSTAVEVDSCRPCRRARWRAGRRRPIGSRASMITAFVAAASATSLTLDWWMIGASFWKQGP